MARRETSLGSSNMLQLSSNNRKYLMDNFLSQDFPIEILDSGNSNAKYFEKRWKKRKLSIIQDGKEIYSKENLKSNEETLAIVSGGIIFSVYIFRI